MIIPLVHVKTFPFPYLTILGPFKVCLVLKGHQFGELPAEVVTKDIFSVRVWELDLRLLDNTRILVGPDVACRPVNNITKY